MWAGLEILGTYTSETDARIDLARLEAAGLVVRLATDNCGGMRPHFDLDRGVRLLVAPQDLEAAREVLKPAPPDSSHWTCPACGTQGEPGFDACWQCGRPRG